MTKQEIEHKKHPSLMTVRHLLQKYPWLTEGEIRH